MQKLVAILLLGIYLFSTTALAQLFKLPVLIEHYQEHKHQNPAITFLGFLNLHYNNGDKVDDDDDKDMKLPFKTVSDIASTFVISIPPTTFTIISQPVFEYHDVKKKYSQTSNLLLPSFSANIWQPPKFC